MSNKICRYCANWSGGYPLTSPEGHKCKLQTTLQQKIVNTQLKDTCDRWQHHSEQKPVRFTQEAHRAMVNMMHGKV